MLGSIGATYDALLDFSSYHWQYINPSLTEQVLDTFWGDDGRPLSNEQGASKGSPLSAGVYLGQASVTTQVVMDFLVNKELVTEVWLISTLISTEHK